MEHFVLAEHSKDTQRQTRYPRHALTPKALSNTASRLETSNSRVWGPEDLIVQVLGYLGSQDLLEASSRSPKGLSYGVYTMEGLIQDPCPSGLSVLKSLLS